MSEPDYIVVGAGASGCVVAARLSENPKTRVLLLEAGGPDRGLATRIPMLTVLASARNDWNWAFETEPIPGLGGRRQVWNQGRLLGGSSSINGMIYMRGGTAEYDDWAEVGCPGWSFQDLLPHFRRSEANSRGAGHWHGGDGPMRVRPCRLDLPICDLFLEAARAAGITVVDDLNAGVDAAFGRFDCNVDRGRRASAARAYLHPASRRANLEVMRDTLVARVIVEAGRAVGVEMTDGRRIKTHGEVILCGGAINSPALLLASGIGPAGDLAGLGLSVRVDSPEVGANLRNHAALFDQYLSTAPITAANYLKPNAALKAGLSYALKREGPLAETFLAVGGFLKSRASLGRADTIVVMVPSLMQRAVGGRLRDLMPEGQGFTIVTSLGRPRSSGHVRLRSPDPLERPAIFPNMFDDPADLATLARSVARMREMIEQPILSNLIAAECRFETEDLEAIAAEIKERAGTLSHPTGTCRMGSDSMAVVDPQLRVNGIAGLRVADASIVPTAINSCTHAAALMIGEKAAALIAGRDGRSGADTV